MKRLQDFLNLADFLGDEMTEEQASRFMDEAKECLSIEEIQVLIKKLPGTPLYTEAVQYEMEMGGFSNCEPARFKHDCYSCNYLGRYKECDLYFCEKEMTVVGRFSDEAADYTSGMVFARPDGSEILYEAKKRAIKAGLLAG